MPAPKLTTLEERAERLRRDGYLDAPEKPLPPRYTGLGAPLDTSYLAEDPVDIVPARRRWSEMERDR